MQRVLSLDEFPITRGSTTPVAVNTALVTVFITGFFFIHYWTFFQTPYLVEFGDNGINAVQINGAKSFSESLGHYSRWGFHHPGPAFFYWYALGEVVFFDFLHIVGSPAAAHYLISLLLQAFCYGVSIAYMGYKLRLPALMPIALIVLAAHLMQLDDPPVATWIPKVLIGPLVLLVVSAAAVIAGDLRGLPLMAISGGLLINGHVAQPLFVGPIFALALWSVRQRLRHGTSPASRDEMRLMTLSGIVFAILIAPIVFDIVSGKNSNFAAITGHLRKHRVDVANTFAQSIGYFLSYFRYEMVQHDVQGAADFALGGYLATYWSLWLTLSAGIAASVIIVLKERGDPFVRSLAMLTALCVGLTLIWGKIQTGQMFWFNGLINVGIIYLIYLFPTAVAAMMIERHARGALWVITPAGFAIAAALWVSKPAVTPVYIHPVPELARTITAKLAEFGATGAYLSFEGIRWFEASGVAQILMRENITFRVSHPFRGLFRPRNAFDKSPRDEAFLVRHRAATIRVSRAAGTPDEYALPDSGVVIFPGFGERVAVTFTRAP